MLEKLHVRRFVMRIDQLLDFGVAVRETSGADAKVVVWIRALVEDAFFGSCVGREHAGAFVGVEVAVGFSACAGAVCEGIERDGRAYCFLTFKTSARGIRFLMKRYPSSSRRRRISSTGVSLGVGSRRPSCSSLIEPLMPLTASCSGSSVVVSVAIGAMSRVMEDNVKELCGKVYTRMPKYG